MPTEELLGKRGPGRGKNGRNRGRGRYHRWSVDRTRRRTQRVAGPSTRNIEGQTNPTLSLASGTPSDLTWENLDGENHERIIEDADGTELAASDSMEEDGEVVPLPVEASEEMAHYYREYHPGMMRGDITTEG